MVCQAKQEHHIHKMSILKHTSLMLLVARQVRTGVVTLRIHLLQGLLLHRSTLEVLGAPDDWQNHRILKCNHSHSTLTILVTDISLHKVLLLSRLHCNSDSRHHRDKTCATGSHNVHHLLHIEVCLLRQKDSSLPQPHMVLHITNHQCIMLTHNINLYCKTSHMPIQSNKHLRHKCQHMHVSQVPDQKYGL